MSSTTNVVHPGFEPVAKADSSPPLLPLLTDRTRGSRRP